MTISTISMIKDRIKVATKESPIAVYAFNSVTGRYLDSKFAAILPVQSDIEKNHPALVGVYDRSMSIDAIEKELRQAERG